MRKIVVLLCLLAFAGASAAHAGKKKDKHKKGDAVKVTVAFGGKEKELARLYFVEKHGRGNCPPGLAKKNNGCLPPGQAKKRYAVGHTLPPIVAVEPLPVELSVRIGAPPHGYRYGVVDGDLVKLAVGTMLVVDAIEGLVE